MFIIFRAMSKMIFSLYLIFSSIVKMRCAIFGGLIHIKLKIYCFVCTAGLRIISHIIYILKILYTNYLHDWFLYYINVYEYWTYSINYMCPKRSSMFFVSFLFDLIRKASRLSLSLEITKWKRSRLCYIPNIKFLQHWSGSVA